MKNWKDVVACLYCSNRTADLPLFEMPGRKLMSYEVRRASCGVGSWAGVSMVRGAAGDGANEGDGAGGREGVDGRDGVADNGGGAVGGAGGSPWSGNSDIRRGVASRRGDGGCGPVVASVRAAVPGVAGAGVIT